MKSESSATAARINKRLTVYVISNFLFVLFMLAAVLLIRSGQIRYLPHAEVNKEYVSSTLAHGTPEDFDRALKTTEVYRAAGYESLVDMMSFMQAAGVVLALLFVVNGFVLYRLRQQQPVPAPVEA